MDKWTTISHSQQTVFKPISADGARRLHVAKLNMEIPVCRSPLPRKADKLGRWWERVEGAFMPLCQSCLVVMLEADDQPPAAC